MDLFDFKKRLEKCFINVIGLILRGFKYWKKLNLDTAGCSMK